MSGLTKEELELAINMLFKDIEAATARGLDTRESSKRLTLYRSNLLEFIRAEDRTNESENAG